MTLLLAGCSGAPCAPEPGACAPLYEPTWDNVYANTLEPTCGLAGGCHGPDAATAGFEVSEDQDATYASFLGKLEPPDASCSLAIRRMHLDGASGMPPGAPLDDAEICAIQLWVEAGAPAE